MLACACVYTRVLVDVTRVHGDVSTCGCAGITLNLPPQGEHSFISSLFG